MTDQLDRLNTALAGRYAIEREIGRGGMATVYLAHDVRHDRKVAVKVLREELAAVLGSERFLQEIRVTAGLQHPHILPLHDSGEADGFLYYVMPFVVGESLRARLNREGALQLPTALTIAQEVADALSYAHRQGVVHRDIKPENVLLSEGHALVADFGIAKAVTRASDEPLTRTGIALGTPGYMSPEQAAGGSDLDERTDVYSLACVVYEMLVGDVPARWILEEELRQGRILKAPPAHRARLAQLPRSVERALVRAMAIEPEARFATPSALAEALTGDASPGRAYSDSEAKEIIERAASLQAAEPTGGRDFSLSTVKRIAAEVDIPSRHVEAAAGAVDQPVAVTPRVLGIPAGMQLARTVEGELPESEYPALLEMIQETLGEQGQIEATLGNVFAWSSGTGQRAGRVTRVQVSPRGGRTKITIVEDQTASIAVAAGVGAVAIGVAAVPAAEVGAMALLPVMGAVVVGAVAVLRGSWRKRRELLSTLLGRLAGHVTGTARRELPGARDS
ncbi:MAG: protein kinase [Gemmatimonadales bacterium]|nr:protein kinase [Gemmatimonadales bacterium]